MININYSHQDIFILIENKIYIEVKSVDANKTKNPINYLNLQLDTGAFITLINKFTAEEHDYKIIKPKSCGINGFSQQGLICDLRTIPYSIFCEFIIKDFIIATPCSNDVNVTEVLGMNLLENFNFGFDFSDNKIFLSKRLNFISGLPKYKIGEINKVDESNK